MTKLGQKFLAACLMVTMFISGFSTSLFAAENAEKIIIPFNRFGLDWESALPEKIVMLRIWYTLDNGHTWRQYSETDNPSSPAPVKVSEDGVYGFYTQTRDNSGLEEPAPVPGTPPKAVVVVDTKKPALVLVTPNSSDIYSNTQDLRIEWNSSDINYGSKPLSLYYTKDGGGSWNVIKKGVANTGSYNWKIPTVSSQEYRLKIVAVDEAGNESEDISDNNFTVDGRPPVSRVTGPQDAKTPNFDITYTANDLGGAGIAKIALYFQLGDSKEWHLYGEDKDLKSPIHFQARKGGKYGFKIVATDRVGNSEPMPNASTKPDVVCLMDSINPIIKLTNFKGSDIKPVGATKQRPITWKASDDNMAENPIIIELSKDNGVTWKPIVTTYKNSGTFLWTGPQGVDVNKARLRIKALDVLGNEGQDISDAFRIDGTPPRTIIRKVVPLDVDKANFNNTRIEKAMKFDSGKAHVATPKLTPTEYLSRSTEAMNQNDLVTAQEMLNKALGLDKNNFTAHAISGRLNLLKKDYERAITDYTKSIQLNRNYQESRIGLGVSYYTVGNDYAEKRDKDNARAYFKKAILQYEEAVKILPDTWDEYFNLGYIYARMQNYNEAIRNLEKAIPLSSDNGDAYWFLGQVHEKLGNRQEALKAFMSAEKAFPPDSLLSKKANAKVRELQGS